MREEISDAIWQVATEIAGVFDYTGDDQHAEDYAGTIQGVAGIIERYAAAERADCRTICRAIARDCESQGDTQGMSAAAACAGAIGGRGGGDVSIHFHANPWCCCPSCRLGLEQGTAPRDPIGGLVGITGRELERLQDAAKERDALKARVAELEKYAPKTPIGEYLHKSLAKVTAERDALAAKLAIAVEALVDIAAYGWNPEGSDRAQQALDKLGDK